MPEVVGGPEVFQGTIHDVDSTAVFDKSLSKDFQGIPTKLTYFVSKQNINRIVMLLSNS